jgi:hypothetical protein
MKCDKGGCPRVATTVQAIRGESYEAPLCNEHRLEQTHSGATDSSACRRDAAPGGGVRSSQRKADG